MIKTIPALEDYVADLEAEIAACGSRWSKAKRDLSNQLIDAKRELRDLYGRA